MLKRDFYYSFFSNAMQQQLVISPHVITSRERDAKNDFPIDYEAYYEDDSVVGQEYRSSRWNENILCQKISQ